MTAPSAGGGLLPRAAGALVLRRFAGPRWSRERVIETERFGIAVEDAAKLDRIRGILASFFAGLERGLATPGAVKEEAGRRDPLYRPFFAEGAAMALVPAAWMRLRGTAVAIRTFAAGRAPEDPHVILEHIGIGFWLGFQRLGLERAAAAIEPRYRHLLHDGLGFQTGFFRLPRVVKEWGRIQPPEGFLERLIAIRRLRRLPGFARASAMSGLGRSLWFFSMDRPGGGAAVARALGADRDWVIGGMGLAAAYTFPDDLGVAYGSEGSFSPEERLHFRKGVRIALYARHENAPGPLREWIRALREPLRTRAEDDLAIALEAGRRTRSRDDFVEAFHACCLDANGGPR